MDPLHQILLTAVVAHKSVDDIIDDLEIAIAKYKQQKISGGGKS